MKCQVLVDWLTFSVKGLEPFEVIRTYLGMDPSLFQDAGFGLMGYTQDLFFSDIHVLYEPRENSFFHDMGVCVSMSGNGCRTFETMSALAPNDKQGVANSAFSILFELLASSPDSNISRIDIACDDREGYLDMDAVVCCVNENKINSRMTRRSVVTAWDGRERSGATVYIGAPSSDFRIRIYDKALEEGVDGHWVRVEMVMRGKNANAFVAEAVNAGAVGELAAQVINDKFSFIERDDTNITRCTVCGWWARFVGELAAVHLVARCVVRHTVERVNDWLEYQIAPSLAMILDTMGFARLFEMAVDARSRLSEKQKAVVNDYNALRKEYARVNSGSCLAV